MNDRALIKLGYKLDCKEMAKQYIGSQEHFEDKVNSHYDEMEQYQREMQKQYEDNVNEQMELDYYNRQHESDID